jgi:hypothetical protein
MPVQHYHDQLEPKNQDAIIWRFMSLEKFRDLMVSGELYFCRADLFNENDEREGLPPEEFLKRWGKNPLDLNDRRELINHIGTVAEFRENYYVSCWHLFREETCKMWEKYGRDGVAICSRYDLLKSALQALPDRASIGLVRYDSSHMIKANLFSYITYKREMYADEQEVRAFFWILDPNGRGDRHIDAEGRVHPHVLTPPPDRVSKGERRAVDLHKLISQIVVTPWASPTLVDEVEEIVKTSGHAIPVIPSELARYKQFLPDPEAGEIRFAR